MSDENIFDAYDDLAKRRTVSLLRAHLETAEEFLEQAVDQFLEARDKTIQLKETVAAYRQALAHFTQGSNEPFISRPVITRADSVLNNPANQSLEYGVTKQSFIIKTIRTSPGLTPAEIVQQLKRTNLPIAISRNTVYSTLHWLVKKGIIRRDNSSRYFLV